MSSRTPQSGPRGAWSAALWPALGVLLATLAMCLATGAYEHGQRAVAPVAGVSVPASSAEERLVSPGEDHDRCCGRPIRETRAVLPVGTQPLPAVLARTPFVPPPGTTSHLPDLPSPRGAPDLHVLQVQRI
jgi:hypothetical protein